MAVVVKVGGKSQSTPEMVEHFVAEADSYFHDEPILWVFSAIGDTTERLQDGTASFDYPHVRFLKGDPELSEAYKSARELLGTCHAAYSHIPMPANKAALLTCGERMAAVLGTAAIRKKRRGGAACLDYMDSSFPAVASAGENYLSANFDVERSRERSGLVKNLLKGHDVVIPGFGGVSGGVIKTFGRGGSDESAFGCGNIVRANGIYICTDVNGIMQAVSAGISGATVEEIDVEEAKAGAFLGAKLPSEQALMPLENSYETGHVPEVYIVNATDFGGARTKIVPESNHDAVKFVAGRNIPLYAVVAGSKHKLLELERYLTERGVDYLIAVKSGTRAEIGIFGKGSDVAAGEFKMLCKEFGLRYEVDNTRAIVGVVGRGLKNAEGVDERLYSSLHHSGINVLSSHDYSDFSTGSVIRAADRDMAIGSLYKSFFT